MPHRGRFQAQGGNFNDSEPWARQNPFTIREANLLLTFFADRIPNNERQRRARGFRMCSIDINSMHNNGGVNVANLPNPLRKSYPQGYQVRVDLEVRSGWAFV